MTDKEKYKRTFSVLHASEENLEVINMNSKRRIHISKKVTTIIAAAVAAVTMCVGAYAADVGGIQRKVQIWLHGDQTDAVLDVQQGDHTEYTLTYKDENGENHEIHGGGVAMDGFGGERPLTEEEIMDHISNEVEVMYYDDGKIIAFYKDCSVDITDKFDEDGYCYVEMKDGKDTIYVTVEKDKGWSTSHDKFILPDEH